MLSKADSTFARDDFYYKLNVVFATGHICLLFFCFFFLPFFFPHAGWFLLMVGFLTSNAYWAVLHEAIHGRLCRTPSVNRKFGRLMAVLFGSSFLLLRFGHLTHHRFNRHPLDCPDLYDPRRIGRFSAFLKFYAELFFGLYMVELFLPLAFWLPIPLCKKLLQKIYQGQDGRIIQIHRLAQKQLVKKSTVSEIRRDSLFHLFFLLGLIFVWNSQWPFLLGFYLLRGALLSFMDNIYHFGTSPSDPDYAYNLSLPGFIRIALLNMNLHRVHHRHIELAWWQLPRQFSFENEKLDYPFGQLLLRQLKGPLPKY